MLIQLENVVKNYVDDELVTPALRGVSFEIKEGAFVAVTGSSGSGKSTLMHIIGFLDKLTSGEYFFDGENASHFDDDKLAEIRNQKVGFVFQSYNLLPRTSVLDNVLLPTIYTPRLDKKETENRARYLLEKVGLSHRVNHRPNQLSGGEQQRVAIVRALINRPRLILADEPTGNLDSKSGQEVMEVLQDLNEEGHTILMVTHEKYVAECAKRIIDLKDGRVLTDTKVNERHIAKNGIEK
ncbi:ABC transporter ATP-binding protein [Patescibacteria group bacterium]|nr:ABC transporter ATP-binding protein [Patescibacteria group bacterium]MBU2579861.1 ABC transporter ATP-binding protein [Patescibacteria group bacterium]MBU4031080.1 ABC transporter ATP-binding protein [Patescibacteria group bacterium]MCG2809492.1 ABC transporter ATP-binding protein [Candidatus Portnoybacteria bacterium]